MRDLKRRTANVLAIHTLAEAGLEVFTPMTQMVMTIGGRRQRRDVPVIQDLLFVHATKEILDPYVARYPNLQYRYRFGRSASQPTVIREHDMQQFIFAVTHTQNPRYYMPGELTPDMFGRKVRIVGGLLDNMEGRLLSIKGMRKRRLIIELPYLITTAVEVEPEFVQFI